MKPRQMMNIKYLVRQIIWRHERPYGKTNPSGLFYACSDDEKERLRDYLKRILQKNSSGKYYNVKDKADWVLIWWKK